MSELRSSERFGDSDKSPPLILEGVKKVFIKGATRVEAVKGVSFSLKAGEIFALLGPNGAGKTTCINMMTSLDRPDSGDVKVFGFSVLSHPLEVKKNLGVVHQELSSHGFFNVEEILNFYSGYYGIRNNQTQIDFLLEKLDLKEHRKKQVKQLSGGMKRRLMIAKALVHRPRLLLLDEPTAGVDVELRNSLWKFVRELRDSGMTILLTTHYLTEAEQLCDRVGILDRGDLKYFGPTKTVIDKLTKKRVEISLKVGGPNSVKTDHPFVVGQKEGTLSLALPPQIELGEAFAQIGLRLDQIQDLKTREGTLEEAFLSVVRGGGVL